MFLVVFPTRPVVCVGDAGLANLRRPSRNDGADLRFHRVADLDLSDSRSAPARRATPPSGPEPIRRVTRSLPAGGPGSGQCSEPHLRARSPSSTTRSAGPRRCHAGAVPDEAPGCRPGTSARGARAVRGRHSGPAERSPPPYAPSGDVHGRTSPAPGTATEKGGPMSSRSRACPTPRTCPPCRRRSTPHDPQRRLVPLELDRIVVAARRRHRGSWTSSPSELDRAGRGGR